MMKELVERIARELVDQPDQVSVTEIEGGRTVVFELRVAKSDIGKIIGKRGQNVNAIRTILNAVSGKSRKQVVLELIE
ncbi:MAG TPA: KH domain-containing protein [Deltaproteobacteria bacterium]|nr:KH domain-containing protein [Deltaproteobacteria bacterium]